MKQNRRMNWTTLLRWLPLAVLSLGLTGETCTEDRTIEVVVGADVFATFEARGIINTFDEVRTVDLIEDADIKQILEDNGFEDKVIVHIESAFYRVTKRDANATDRTVSGTVMVATGGGAETLLLTGSAAVNEPGLAVWTPALLDATGVALINTALQAWIDEVLLGNPDPPHPTLTFHTTGTSDPQGVETNFDWEIDVKMTLAGWKTITVIEPI